MGPSSVMPAYGGQASHNKMMNPSSHSHPGHAQSTSAVNGRALPHAVNTMPHASGMNRLAQAKTALQVPLPHPMQMNALGATPPPAPATAMAGWAFSTRRSSRVTWMACSLSAWTVTWSPSSGTTSWMETLWILTLTMCCPTKASHTVSRRRHIAGCQAKLSE